jgi:hypothetical protein
VRGDEGKIDIARFLDRFAAVHRFKHGQLSRFFLDDSRDAVEKFSSFASGHFAPNVFVSASGGADRKIDIFRVALGDLGEFFFRGRIDRCEIFPRARRDKLSADEQLIARLEANVVARFRRGRVAPSIAETQLPPAGWKRNAAMRNYAVALEDNELSAT